jgi:hypothetical protein
MMMVPHLCLCVIFISEIERIAVEQPGVQIELQAPAAPTAAAAMCQSYRDAK